MVSLPDDTPGTLIRNEPCRSPRQGFAIGSADLRLDDCLSSPRGSQGLRSTMKFLRSSLFFLAVFATANADEPSAPKLPIITLPVRVHLVQSETMPEMHTTLVEADIRRIFGKVNAVWEQAGIRFEIESIGPTQAVALKPELRDKSEFVQVKAMIPKDRLSATALDVCYVKKVKPNGFFYGEPIVVKDTASLKEVPGGLDEPLPRVTSHEIGHALGLQHRQDMTNLMASGTTGFSLNAAEIATARAKAQERLEKGEPASGEIQAPSFPPAALR